MRRAIIRAVMHQYSIEQRGGEQETKEAHLSQDRRLHDPRKMKIDWREKYGVHKVEVRGSSSGLGVAPPESCPDPRRAFTYHGNLQSICLIVVV
jgi:hypothetical protein